MEMLPFPISQNITGPEPDLKSFCGKGNNISEGFENILEGILGSSNPNAGFLKAEASDSGKISGEELNILKNIIKKFSKAIGESRQGIDVSKFQDILEKTLTEDEIALLVDVLQKNFSETGVELDIQPDQLNDGSKDFTLKVIEKAILVLNGLIEQIKGAEKSLLPKQEINLTQGQDGELPTLQLLIALKDKMEQIRSGLKSPGFSVSENSKAVQLLYQKEDWQKEDQIIDKSGDIGRKQGLEDSSEPVKRLRELFQQLQGLKKSVSSGAKSSKNIKPGDVSTGLSKVLNDNGKQNSLSSTGQDPFMLNPEPGNKNTVNLNPNLFKEISNETLDKLFEKLNLSAKADAKVTVEKTANNLKFENHFLRDNDKGNSSKRSLFNRNILNIEETTSGLNQTTKSEILHSNTPRQYINPSYIIDQITEKINFGVSRGQSRISIQLHPPSLGKIQIDLSMNQNQLRAVIVAESTQVKQILESNLDQLRACLESQNIEVDKFSVSVGQEDRQFASFFKDRNGKEKKSFSVQAITAEEEKSALHEESVNRMIPVTMKTGRETLDIFV